MSLKVLLVEDEPLIQRTLKLLLERKGAKVTPTNNGKSAIELIINNDFDIIICDLMLQDITGFDIIEESKKKLTPKDISEKFTIITAYSSDQILERANNYGCTVYSKPFENVNDVIDEILRGNND